MKNRSAVVAEAYFPCAVCDNEAGCIRLLESASSSEVWRTSFTSALVSPVPTDQFSGLRAAIERRDARALHELDTEYAPFFCPHCNTIYCGAHWATWDVFDEADPTWHDSIRGRCPKGHERMLED